METEGNNSVDGSQGLEDGVYMYSTAQKGGERERRMGRGTWWLEHGGLEDSVWKAVYECRVWKVCVSVGG